VQSSTNILPSAKGSTPGQAQAMSSNIASGPSGASFSDTLSQASQGAPEQQAPAPQTTQQQPAPPASEPSHSKAAGNGAKKTSASASVPANPTSQQPAASTAPAQPVSQLLLAQALPVAPVAVQLSTPTTAKTSSGTAPTEAQGNSDLQSAGAGAVTGARNVEQGVSSMRAAIAASGSALSGSALSGAALTPPSTAKSASSSAASQATALPSIAATSQGAGAAAAAMTVAAAAPEVATATPLPQAPAQPATGASAQMSAPAKAAFAAYSGQTGAALQSALRGTGLNAPAHAAPSTTASAAVATPAVSEAAPPPKTNAATPAMAAGSDAKTIAALTVETSGQPAQPVQTSAPAPAELPSATPPSGQEGGSPVDQKQAEGNVQAVTVAAATTPALVNASLIAGSTVAPLPQASASRGKLQTATQALPGSQSAKEASKPDTAVKASSNTVSQPARPATGLTAATATPAVQAASSGVGTAATPAKDGAGAAKPVEKSSATPEAHKSQSSDSQASNAANGVSGSGASTSASGSTSGAQGAAAANGTAANAPVQNGAGPADQGTQAAMVVPVAATQAAPAALEATGSGPAVADGKHDDLSAAVASGAASASEAHALPPIHTASVLESMQGSEMRVGMRSAEFGNVSVSTSVNRESIAAQISFEHMDLGKALTAHLPSIEAKLSSDYGVHAKVEVRDQSMGASADNGRGDGRRGDSNSSSTGTPRDSHTSSADSAYMEGLDALTVSSSTASAISAENSRLDVRA